MAPDVDAAPTADPEFANQLFDAALLRGSFTLRSGVTSDRYFDKYRMSCDPGLLAPVAAALAHLQRRHEPAAVRLVAPALGAVPLVTAMALAVGLPFAIVRDAAKSYGTGNRIEGPIRSGERIVVIEDVVTSGGAVLDTIHAARAAGLVVDHALCVLDRQAGGGDALAAAGVQLHALLTVADLDRAFDAGRGQRSAG